MIHFSVDLSIIPNTYTYYSYASIPSFKCVIRDLYNKNKKPF